MIVLDDQISNRFIASQITRWYPGAVVSIRDSRPHGLILDPEIPTLLRALRQPTFVTINYKDFFNRQFARRMGKIISWTETGITHLTL